MDLISYRIGAGHDLPAAKRHQFLCIEHCLEVLRGAKFSGQVWMAPITTHGTGRWVFVGRYDGRGNVFLGLEDEAATAEGLLSLLEYRMR